jgi:hypothetical protein
MEKIMSKKVDKVAQVVEELSGSEAGKIWSEIKEKSIEMFALPDQKVADHCFPVNIEPSKLYLRTKSSAVLPSLEVSCGKNFLVELVDKYVTVTRVTAPLTKK